MAASPSWRPTLREELAKARGEVDAVRRANSYVLGEVESMETRRILERECARDGLVRVLELNEAVLESAVAAMRAEEERSVFFQEATLELLNSGRDKEAVRRQKEALESMEGELLAKTVEVDCLRSELKMLKELYVSSEMAGKDQEQEPDVAQKQICLATEISREVDQVDGKMTEDVAGAEGGGKACQGDSEVGDTYFDSELPGHLNVQYDDEDEIHGSTNDSVPEHDVEGHEEPELGDRFVDESFKTMHSEYCKDISAAIGMPENLAGKGKKGSKSEGVTGIVVVSSKDGMPASSKQKKEVRFLDESFKSMNSDDCKDMNGVHGNLAGKRRPEPEAAGAGFVSEIVVVNSKDADGDGKFYSNATGDADKLGNGYVLVAKTEADGEALKDIDVAHAEISDLRFSLEEAVRRAELAEEAKAALERELKEEIKMKQRQQRPPAPSQDRKIVVRRPAPGCVTLGKMLNMKYK